jgi:hypothetical protein
LAERLPLETARLFPEGGAPAGGGVPGGDVGKSVWVRERDGAAVAGSFVIGRLLEDGDGADLRWLFANVPEEAAAAWLGERGGRQLSARSRAFWEVLLGVPAGPASEIGRELWPL